MTPTSASIDAAAAQWVARMDSENWTEADDLALEDWLNLDIRHRGALVQAQALWSTLSETHSFQSIDGDVEQPASSPSRRGLLLWAGGALAASVVGGLYLTNAGSSYSTDIGELRRVALDDGSTAALNTDSKVEVVFAKDARVVRLDRGEAWFEVHKDTTRPFEVEAGDIRVRAVGTAFAVRLRTDGTEISVTEGVVDVWKIGEESSRMRLRAGGTALVSDSAAIVRELSEPDAIERSLAWRTGKIDLVGTRVKDAINDINRYNKRKVILADPSLAAEEFDGVFRTNDPEGFARVIAGSFDRSLDFTNPGEIRIVTR
jgi:transmembrane sensor